MNLDEIRAAVERGETVHWANDGYTVHKDGHGQWLIQCDWNLSCIGLTWNDGVTMNGRPEDFYVDMSEYNRIVRAEQRMNP